MRTTTLYDYWDQILVTLPHPTVRNFWADAQLLPDQPQNIGVGDLLYYGSLPNRRVTRALRAEYYT